MHSQNIVHRDLKPGLLFIFFFFLIKNNNNNK
jgi:hypothetical protein